MSVQRHWQTGTDHHTRELTMGLGLKEQYATLGQSAQLTFSDLHERLLKLEQALPKKADVIDLDKKADHHVVHTLRDTISLQDKRIVDLEYLVAQLQEQKADLTPFNSMQKRLNHIEIELQQMATNETISGIKERLEKNEKDLTHKANQSSIKEIEEEFTQVEGAMQSKVDSSTATAIQKQLDALKEQVEAAMQEKLDARDAIDLKKKLKELEEMLRELKGLDAKGIADEFAAIERAMKKKADTTSITELQRTKADTSTTADLERELEALKKTLRGLGDATGKADFNDIADLRKQISLLKEAIKQKVNMNTMENEFANVETAMHKKAEVRTVRDLEEQLTAKADEFNVEHLQKQIDSLLAAQLALEGRAPQERPKQRALEPPRSSSPTKDTGRDKGEKSQRYWFQG